MTGNVLVLSPETTPEAHYWLRELREEGIKFYQFVFDEDSDESGVQLARKTRDCSSWIEDYGEDVPYMATEEILEGMGRSYGCIEVDVEKGTVKARPEVNYTPPDNSWYWGDRPE